MPLHRTQILLEPDQHQALQRIARAEKRSMSDVVRDAVRKELKRRDDDVVDRVAKRLAWIKAGQEIADRIAKRRGGKPIEPWPDEIIHQMREERHAEHFAHAEKLMAERRRAASGGG